MTAGETHVRAVATTVEFFPGRIQIRWQIEFKCTHMANLSNGKLPNQD